MLYVIQKGFNSVTPVKAGEIVYCVTSVQDILNSGADFIFSDGHAVDGLTQFYDPENVADIENIIDFNAVKSLFWKDDNDLDLKRRKEAEFLVGKDVPPEAIRGWVVCNKPAKTALVSLGIEDSQIAIRPTYYF